MDPSVAIVERVPISLAFRKQLTPAGPPALTSSTVLPYAFNASDVGDIGSIKRHDASVFTSTSLRKIADLTDF